MNTLRWLRVVGDTTFAVGAVLLTLFVAGLASGSSYHRPRRLLASERAHSAAE
jgi:nitric oxide reductase subunit B